jgi:hypothetical protein
MSFWKTPRTFWQTREEWWEFGKFFGLQFLQYLVLTINFRAIAHEQYAMAGTTAAVAAWFAYTIVRGVAADKSHFALPGMMIGGALADVTGIYLTRHW